MTFVGELSDRRTHSAHPHTDGITAQLKTEGAAFLCDFCKECEYFRIAIPLSPSLLARVLIFSRATGTRDAPHDPALHLSLTSLSPCPLFLASSPPFFCRLTLCSPHSLQNACFAAPLRATTGRCHDAPPIRRLPDRLTQPPSRAPNSQNGTDRQSVYTRH